MATLNIYMRGELVGFAAVISWVAVVQGGVSGCGLHFAVMLVHTHQWCQVASSIAKFGKIGIPLAKFDFEFLVYLANFDHNLDTFGEI